MPVNNSRIAWIDTLKGIAIFFVVMGHIPCPEWLHTWIYSFHMPLFFLASGFFLTKGIEKPFVEVATKRQRRLMVPYYFYGLLLIIPFNIFTNYLGHLPLNISGQILGQVFGIRHAFGMSGTLWFLPCLFLASMMVWSAWKYAHKYRWLVILLLSAFGFTYVALHGLSLPYSLDLAFVAAFFIAFGAELIVYASRISWPIALACLVIAIVACWINGPTDMYSSNLGHYPLLFLVSSILGSAFIIKVSMTLSASKFFSTAGRYSLTIYIFHFVLKFPFSVVLGKLDLGDLAGGVVLAVCNIIFTAVIIWLLFPISKFVEQRFPRTLGLTRR